ncbi:arsenite efflux transporter metallochaperone ArsD [Aeromonas enteropelogenes]|uniref:arsenite efflux transporter metallochaperone ArsD n=1 Tax=Aeromonas enteropelogenes TaxID=29489 RepID=UPI0005A89D84|nr:arsenite efflux transporter metallochaperone ArsD [Aeromonas enteropelogenes]UBH52374.1 arsenite efflux transporter metallochaperone ArsD [Aeromonas enteropelogenes]
MSVIQTFDPALCCASGVCGTEVDQALVTFAADLAWVREQGGAIERFNLAQQPLQFAETPAVCAFLTHAGEEGLPLVLVDGQVVLTGRYPSRGELARYAGLPAPQATIKGIVKGGCRPGSGCC